MKGLNVTLDDLQSEENKLLFLRLIAEQTAEKINAVKQIQELKQKLK